jgi:hypothetical protein
MDSRVFGNSAPWAWRCLFVCRKIFSNSLTIVRAANSYPFANTAPAGRDPGHANPELPPEPPVQPPPPPAPPSQPAVPEDPPKQGEGEPDSLQDAAKSGDADAQYTLFKRYIHGTGVPKDTSEALRWMQKLHESATQGNPAAQYAMGRVYSEKESGIGQDFAEAEKWWRLAAKNKSDPATAENAKRALLTLPKSKEQNAR